MEFLCKQIKIIENIFINQMQIFALQTVTNTTKTSDTAQMSTFRQKINFQARLGPA